MFEPESISSVLEETKRRGESRNVDTPHLVASYYKKGTTHIVFKDADLLKKFNYIGSQRRGWLPPELWQEELHGHDQRRACRGG